ncbi:MAG: DUF2080 family transposase-associated protein [Nitrososphaeria archaeon]
MFTKKVTKFENGARICCSRKYFDRRVYVLVLKDGKADG